MGMGEPLDNYENVMAAVKVMPDKAFGVALKTLGPRRCFLWKRLLMFKKEAVDQKWHEFEGLVCYSIKYVFGCFCCFCERWLLLWGLNTRNVTISTVGVAGRIRALANELPSAGPNLALSLHAPTQDQMVLQSPLKARNLISQKREVQSHGFWIILVFNFLNLIFASHLFPI